MAYWQDPGWLNPTMTAADAPSPNIVTESNYSGIYRGWKAFDRNTSDPWWYDSGSVPQSVKLDLGSGNTLTPNAICLTTAANQTGSPGMPTAWYLDGSNNDSDWTRLITVSSNPAWEENNETRRFFFSNTTAYRYFRLTVTEIEGGSGVRLQLNQIDLVDTDDVGYSHDPNCVSPVMTDHDAPPPYVVVGTGDYLFNPHPGWTAFLQSEDYATYWQDWGGGDFYLSLDYGADNSRIVTAYTITAKANNGSFPCAPKDWVFQGSNNESDWTDLDTRTDEIDWGCATMRRYEFENSTPYRYYRLYITEAEGGTANVIVKELEHIGLGRSCDLSDTLQPVRDSISWLLQKTRTVNVSDTLRPVIDSLSPHRILARHFSYSLSDRLAVIQDSPSKSLVHSFLANVTDVLAVMHDRITSGRINLESNLESARRWVAPLTITPRVADIDPIYLAAHPVLHPAFYFEPRVRSYGTFTRAISAPVGFVKTGDCAVDLVDPDNSIRQRIAAKTIRKATAELRLGPEGGSLQAFLRPYKREVGTVTQPSDGQLNVSLRDFVYDFLEDQVPPEIDEERYPNLPENPSRNFAPIIIGEVASDYGAVPLFLVDTANFGYMVARHPCKSVDAVYRKRAGEDEFSLVSASEYTVDNLEDPDADRFHCIVNFNSDQADAEIRANVTGHYYTDTGLLRSTNFADFILEIFETILGVNSLDRINYASFDETRERLTEAGLSAAGAFTEAITFGEALSQIQRSCNVDLFSDKNDRVSVHYTTDEEDPVAHLDDLLRLHKGTVSQSLADPTYNRIPYGYSLNYATQKWIEDEFNNEEDQEKLGEVISEEPLQLYWIRDAAMADYVVDRRAQYLDLNSFRFEADIPLIPVLEDLELADLVSIEHFGGIKQGGYVAEQFKVLELSMNVDQLRYHVKGIRRKLPPPNLIESSLTGAYGVNCRVGPFYNQVEGEFFAVFKGNPDTDAMKVWVTEDFGETWEEADAEHRPDLGNLIISFDAYQSDGHLHVATQESTGRVAYHTFDLTTRLWETVDEEVIASTTSPGFYSCAVSIETRYPSGEPVILFQGDRALVGSPAVMRARAYFSIRQAGVWSEPVSVSNSYWNVGVQRIVAGRDDKMHVFYTVDPGMFVDDYGDWAVTVNSDLSLSATFQAIRHNFLYYPAPYNVGGVVTHDDHQKISLVRKSWFGNVTVDRYSDNSPVIAVGLQYLPTQTIHESNGETLNPAGYMARLGDTMYLVQSVWETIAGPGYVSLTKSFDGGTTWDDWQNPIKASPRLYQPEMVALVTLKGDAFRIRGRDYLAYFWSGPNFRWIAVNSLPYEE